MTTSSSHIRDYHDNVVVKKRWTELLGPRGRTGSALFKPVKIFEQFDASQDKDSDIDVELRIYRNNIGKMVNAYVKIQDMALNQDEDV